MFKERVWQTILPNMFGLALTIYGKKPFILLFSTFAVPKILWDYLATWDRNDFGLHDRSRQKSDVLKMCGQHFLPRTVLAIKFQNGNKIKDNLKI